MKVEFDFEIEEGAKVIVPISVKSDLDGDKLKKLLEALKQRQCDVTVLIADALQRHNVGDEEALRLGESYHSRNTAILSSVKILHWDDFIKGKEEEFLFKRELIETASKNGSDFYTKMVRTQKKCAVSKDLKSSLLYQKEEYAVFLMMSEFDYHVYPKQPSPAMGWLYKEFPDIQKPKYRQAKFSNFQAENIQQLGIFKEPNIRHTNSYPWGIRMLINNFNEAIKSPEISLPTKQNLLDDIISMCMSMQSELNEQMPLPKKQLVN